MCFHPSSATPASRKPASIGHSGPWPLTLLLSSPVLACLGLCSSCPHLVPMPRFIVPKMCNRAFDTQVAVHFVPGSSQEFLSCPICLRPSEVPAECGTGRQGTVPGCVGTARTPWALLSVGLEVGIARRRPRLLTCAHVFHVVVSEMITDSGLAGGR